MTDPAKVGTIGKVNICQSGNLLSFLHLVGIELHIVMLIIFISAINQTLSLLLTPVYSTEPSDQITKPFLFVDIDHHWAMDAILRAFEKNIDLYTLLDHYDMLKYEDSCYKM